MGSVLIHTTHSSHIATLGSEWQGMARHSNARHSNARGCLKDNQSTPHKGTRWARHFLGEVHPIILTLRERLFPAIVWGEIMTFLVNEHSLSICLIPWPSTFKVSTFLCSAFDLMSLSLLPFSFLSLAFMATYLFKADLIIHNYVTVCKVYL